MDRRNLAQELRKWVVEEMGLPQQKAPSEELLQRLFIGQCADIWKYIIRHVFNQGTVRKMEGNLLWYQQIKLSETQSSVEEKEHQRRKQLCREVQDLRSELQHLREQIHSAQQLLANRSQKMEPSLDLSRRVTLLDAYRSNRDAENDALCEGSAKIETRCKHLQDLDRISQVSVVFGVVNTGMIVALNPEPTVLTDVRKVFHSRNGFLQSLHDDTLLGAIRVTTGDARMLSHKRWMSEAVKIWNAYAPNHVLGALERIAYEVTEELRHLQASFASDQRAHAQQLVEEAVKVKEQNDLLQQCRQTSSLYRPIAQNPSDTVPSYSDMLQVGWNRSIKVSSELNLIKHHIEAFTGRLATVTQEIHNRLSEGGKMYALTRIAFDTELRYVLLRGIRDGLQLECQALEEKVAEKKKEAALLQQEQEKVHRAQKVLEKKQKQIQILMKGDTFAKAQIYMKCLEVQKFIQEKFHTLPQEIATESHRLQDCINKEASQFSSIFLPSLQCVSVDGVNPVPVHDLSINRLSTTVHNSYHEHYKRFYESVGLATYKAPECLLDHVADLKKNLFFLRTRLTSRHKTIENLHRALNDRDHPETEVLLNLLAEHYDQQTQHLVPKLQFLMQQCQKSQEYGKDVQAAITDWWEQPAQQCLPCEERDGLTLQQWRDKWTVAATALQRASGGRS
ncbi:HAUS augmin-like complex subunit 5 [Pelodytes ibericus]